MTRLDDASRQTNLGPLSNTLAQAKGASIYHVHNFFDPHARYNYTVETAYKVFVPEETYFIADPTL